MSKLNCISNINAIAIFQPREWNARIEQQNRAAYRLAFAAMCRLKFRNRIRDDI